MSTHVHRDGAQQITVEDPEGRSLILITKGRELEMRPSDPGPRLTTQMAHDLADELHQWAYAQQSVPVRRRVVRLPGSD